MNDNPTDDDKLKDALARGDALAAQIIGVAKSIEAAPGTAPDGERRVNSRGDATTQNADPWHGTMRDHADGQPAQQSQHTESLPVLDDKKPAEQFHEAARVIASTPQSQRERDLAAVTNSLVELAGVKHTPEHVAFVHDQAARGDQITKERDPDVRAELRIAREAVAHDYAAGLADLLGTGLDAAGQRNEAGEMKTLAVLHREIAAELRGPEQSPSGNTTGTMDGEGHVADEAAKTPELGHKLQAVIEVDPSGTKVVTRVKSAEFGKEAGAYGNAPTRPGAIPRTNGPTDEDVSHDADIIRRSEKTRDEATAAIAAAHGAPVSSQEPLTPGLVTQKRSERAAALKDIRESLDNENDGSERANGGTDHKAAFRSSGR